VTGRRWILLTFVSLGVVVGILASIAYVVDPYGVLRDSAGRKLSVFTNERKVKVLMNKRYVPSNFDGLLVGTSSSANWDVPVVAGARIYNESLEGGDAVEGRILVNEAMRKGRYKLAVLILSHAMTWDHSVKDGMDKVSTAGAIGSLYLFSDEVRTEMIALHYRFARSDTAPDGQIELLYSKKLTPVELPSDKLRIDPIAVEEYRNLINSLESTGTKIVYVVPPMYEPCHQVNKGYDAHLQSVRSLLPPGPVIDFDGPEYANFRSDSSNYLDCWHLEPRGAAQITHWLQKLVPEAIVPSEVSAASAKYPR
jgi:hypothetical protein